MGWTKTIFERFKKWTEKAVERKLFLNGNHFDQKLVWIILKVKKLFWTKIILERFKIEQKRIVNGNYFWTILTKEHK